MSIKSGHTCTNRQGFYEMPAKEETTDQLIAQCIIIEKGGTKCWGSKLDDKAKAFVLAVQKRLDEGEPTSLKKALRILKNKLGVDIEMSAFRHHIKRECCCVQEKPKR